MPAPDRNVLSVISNHLSTLVATSVTPKVSVGPPADADPGDKDSDPLVNLFFYRIEPSGFYPDITSHDPWYVRIQCLVTAFGSMSSEEGDEETSSNISAGEINLRLLGSVLQVFHENPVQDVVFKRPIAGMSDEEEIRTSLQIVFKPLSTEEINQIWSTQGDIAYRSSVAYELALAPIVPTTRRPIPAPVASVHLSSAPIPSAATPAARRRGGTNVAPRLNKIADPERAMVEKGKANHAELPPELLITTPPSRDRIIVRGWSEIPAAGQEPRFVTELETVELTFTPYAALSDHVYFVFEREQRNWRQVEEATVTVSAGDTSAAIAVTVPGQPGERMIYVESQLAGAGGEMTTVRSNVVSVSVVAVSEPVPNGGGP